MSIKVAHSRPPKLNFDLILLILSPPQHSPKTQWHTTSRPPPLYALARTRFRSRRSIIHPPRIPPETPSAFHTPLVYHEALPTMLLRLYILGGEVGVTVAPVTAILTTALTTTRVATITPGAHIASVPTDTTTTVPVPMYASLFFSINSIH